MKKLLFSVAILAVAASCSQSEVVDMPQTSQIGFTTLNDRVISKAANDGDDAFRVFAQKGTATTWFIDDYVAYTDATDAIAPVGGPYYWPTDGSSMKFYAYAPYTTSDCNVAEGTPATDAITLTYTVPADAQEDFTVAAPITCAAYDTTAETVESTYKEYVDFQFAHMLSKVTVKVVLSEDFALNNYISIDDSEDAYSDEDGSTDTTDYNEGDAAFTATFVPYTSDVVVANGLTGAYTSSTASSPSASYEGYTSYYIAPQPFASCKLQINGITIRDYNTNSALFDGQGTNMAVLTLTGNELSNFVDDAIVNEDAFLSGKHYIFTVTIDGSATTEEGTTNVEILFSATTAEWTEAGDYTVGLDQI